MPSPKTVDRRGRPLPAVSAADQLRRHLRPGERLLWAGRPHPRIYGASRMQPAVYGAMIVFFWLLWFLGALFEESLWGVSKWQVLAYASAFLVPPLWLISIPLRHALRARRVAYGITDRRLMVVGEETRAELLSFEPQDIQFVERIDYDGGLGSIFFRLTVQPWKRAWRRRVFWGRYGMLGVEQPRLVESRIRDLAGR